jgi:hypothetical protein
MKKLLSILLFLLLFFPNLLFTQVINVEGKRQSDEKGWSGLTEFAFDYNQSTQTDWEFSNTSYLQWDNNKWSVLLLNEINLDRAGGVDFANDGYQHLRLSKHINETLTIESFVQNQYDPVRNIENRKLGGLGLRAKLKNQNYFGIASFYENEVLTNNIVDNALRLSAYLQLKMVLNTTLSLSTTTYLQPNFSQFSDCKMSNETTLLISITDKFSFTNTVSGGYDTYPAVGIPELIYNFQSGLIYEF